MDLIKLEVLLDGQFIVVLTRLRRAYIFPERAQCLYVIPGDSHQTLPVLGIRQQRRPVFVAAEGTNVAAHVQRVPAAS